MQKNLASEAEFAEYAGSWAARLAPSSEGATVLALSGEIGAGKTTFVQALARSLGIIETVSSPTFVLEKIYDLEGQKFARLVHIDAYRLKGTDELRHLGWDELVADLGNLICVEWPERVPGALPDGAIRLRFEIEGNGRIITIDEHE
jgi:tRNA threonylcarbamoyladenosine biosynthesis protein TsaE